MLFTFVCVCVCLTLARKTFEIQGTFVTDTLNKDKKHAAAYTAACLGFSAQWCGGGGPVRWPRQDLHVWAELVEVPVAVLLHLLWREDGQRPVWVHGDHHTANVRLQREMGGGDQERGRGNITFDIML